MSKKLLEILPTLQTFQDNVISQLTNMFNGVEWLNDDTTYTKQETIYKLLMLKYGDRQIRYDDENIFLNRLVFDLADFLPDIYAKQQVFIKNKLNEFLSDNKNRAVIIDNTSTNTRNTDNNSKFGNSASPLNLVISNANEITNAPITSLNLSNVKLLENYNGNNQQVNYNFVNDLIKTLNNDYSLRLNEFMELLGKHFISVVGSYYRNQNDIQTVKDEPYRFNNGYLVNEVDYLCTDNKQEINRFNEKLGSLNDQVATKQNQLTAGSNITISNNVISANIPQTDLSNYYTKPEVDGIKNNLQNDITANTTEIARVDRVVATNSTNIVNLDSRATNLENNYNTLNNDTVKLNTDQTINGQKTFTNRVIVGTEINAGWGGNPVKFIPDDDRTKTLQFYNNNATDTRRFKLLVPDPTEAQNPTTKNYVDNLNGQNVKLTGDQSIAGNKTFTNNVVISKNPTPLILKANDNQKTYMLIRSSDNTTNFSLGADSGNTSLEVNRGDLTIKTLQANKNVNFENVAKVKFNRSVLEMGQEINAGYGGLNVKFIPEDNSTKTLQFYNANPTDTRRFKLLVPDPTEAQNPATKQYVDNAIATAAPTDLVNRIQAVETKSNTNETNITTNTTSITNLQTKVNTLFNRRVENTTINVAAQKQFRAQNGYEIVNVMVGRKRNDNFMFFTHNEQLNFQVFLHPNGLWTVYNSSTPNRFTNDFQITILEKKV